MRDVQRVGQMGMRRTDERQEEMRYYVPTVSSPW